MMVYLLDTKVWIRHLADYFNCGSQWLDPSDEQHS